MARLSDKDRPCATNGASLGQRSKTLAEAASDSHPILGCDLEKIDAIRNRRRRGASRNGAAQAKACAANGAIELNS